MLSDFGDGGSSQFLEHCLLDGIMIYFTVNYNKRQCGTEMSKALEVRDSEAIDKEYRNGASVRRMIMNSIL